jgi:hypothetical protein
VPETNDLASTKSYKKVFTQKFNVVTLALGSQPKQKLAKVWAKSVT